MISILVYALFILDSNFIVKYFILAQDKFYVASRQGTTRPTKWLIVPHLRQVVPVIPIINNVILVVMVFIKYIRHT